MSMSLPQRFGHFDVTRLKTPMCPLKFHHIFFFLKQCGNTWGSYGNSKRPGCLDRGAGEVLDGIHRYFRGFVLACSFRL